MQVTTALKKISKLRARKRVIQGGTSAGKTYAIIAYLVSYAATYGNLLISIISESVPHLKRGAMKDFVDIMQKTGRWNEASWNKSAMTYTFANGTKIEFFSADKPNRILGARRDIAFINEAINIDFESYTNIAVRTKRFLFLDFNALRQFWVHDEVIDGEGVEFLKLTYQDNEAIDDNVLAELMEKKKKAESSDYWANWWKIFGEGDIGGDVGVLFDNWSSCEDIPKKAELIGYGMDFGFSNSPSALVAFWRFNGELYLREEIYQTKMTNGEMIDKIKTLPRGEIIADDAEPRTIKEIRLGGINIKGVSSKRKGREAGVQILLGYKMNVVQTSSNLIRELRRFAGEKVDDHCIDAMIYFALDRLKTRMDKNYDYL